MKYEDFVKTTDISNHSLQFYLDGMSEEHGELLGIFKRCRRGDYGKAVKEAMDDPARGIKWVIENNPKVKKAVQKELGDYGWYSTRFKQECEWTRDLIDSINQDKLSIRKEEGKIMGHGDERENLPSHDCGKCEILSKKCMEEGCEVMIYGAVAGEKCLLHSISFNNCG